MCVRPTDVIFNSSNFTKPHRFIGKINSIHILFPLSWTKLSVYGMTVQLAMFTLIHPGFSGKLLATPLDVGNVENWPIDLNCIFHPLGKEINIYLGPFPCSISDTLWENTLRWKIFALEYTKHQLWPFYSLKWGEKTLKNKMPERVKTEVDILSLVNQQRKFLFLFDEYVEKLCEMWS